MLLEYQTECFWSAARHVQGSLSHHYMCSSDGVWSKRPLYQTGALKGKSLPRGGRAPGDPPGSAAYVDGSSLLRFDQFETFKITAYYL